METYINNYTVTTAASISNSATSLSVSAAASVAGGFRILVESELMLVTAGGTGTTWTVTRGVEGTTATSHADSLPVNIVMTAAGLSNILAQNSNMVLLEEHTASSSADLEFTSCISSTYDTYVIQFVNVLPATNGVDLYLECSTNGGSSWDTTSGHYSWANFRFFYGGNGEFGNNSDTKITIVDGDATVPNTGAGVCGQLTFYGPLAGSQTMFTGNTISQPTTVGSWGIGWQNYGVYLPATAMNAFRIIASSGNIASGTVRCYGLH
jgi:hypothetical protein